MSSNEVCSVDGLRQRVRAASAESVRLTTLRDRLQAERDARQQEVAELTVEIDILSKVGELYQVLMDTLIVKQIEAVEGLVTESFQTIFDDQDLSFESEVSQKYGKVSIDFFVRSGPKDNPLSHRGRPLESFGGGPTSMASLIIRLLTIVRLKRHPLLLLDETLLAISDEYVAATSQLLRELSSKMGLDIVLVTHKPSFAEHADQAYRCSRVEEGGTEHLKVKRL